MHGLRRRRKSAPHEERDDQRMVAHVAGVVHRVQP
jgi:hypothetical protein